jgi:hypothetical protein
VQIAERPHVLVNLRPLARFIIEDQIDRAAMSPNLAPLGYPASGVFEASRESIQTISTALSGAFVQLTRPCFARAVSENVLWIVKQCLHFPH